LSGCFGTLARLGYGCFHPWARFCEFAALSLVSADELPERSRYHAMGSTPSDEPPQPERPIAMAASSIASLIPARSPRRFLTIPPLHATPRTLRCPTRLSYSSTVRASCLFDLRPTRHILDRATPRCTPIEEPAMDDPEIKMPDPAAWSRSMAEIAQRSQKLVLDFLERQTTESPLPVDPLNVAGAFVEMTQKLMADPAKLLQAQYSLWQDYMTLWQRTAQRILGGETVPPVVVPSPADRRFKDQAWNDSAVFDYIKQSYLLTARWLQGTVRQVEGLDDKTAKKVDFYTRQFVDAMAPSNFVLTNPQVLRATIESGGENLVRGLEHMLEDLERGKGRLSIKMTDT